MIHLAKIVPDVIPVLEAYITKDHSAISIANELSLVEEDADYKVYAISTQGMVTVNANGQWADFDFIMPDFTSAPLCEIQPDVITEKGFPIFSMSGKLCLQTVEKKALGFTLWLTQGKKITKIVQSDILAYYFADAELVGINVANEVMAP